VSEAVTVAEEHVLVVPRALLPELDGWHGLRDDGLERVLAVAAAEARPMPRAAAEQDPSSKQIIPYLVLRDGPRYFLMQRTRAGGDARLHDRWSIGIGGHLEAADGDIEGGLRREWAEELDAASVPAWRAIGALNDDSTDVGAVHLGIVYVADVAGEAVRVRETDKLRGAFAWPDEVRAVYDRLESWSALVFDHLDSAEEQP
jgi:predicted NUDIX family phosphoesterase